MPNYRWHSLQGLPPRQFTCGHCGKFVGTNKGYQGDIDGRANTACVYICSYCEEPTYLKEGGVQIPGVSYGNAVASLPEDIETLYNESRRACSVSAYTASVLATRKILMNVAVAKGAAEGKPFVHYVEYLAGQGYVPPDGMGWVDHIRKKGNEANHEIKFMEHADAEELITFTEMLLKLVYEFPARVPTEAQPT